MIGRLVRRILLLAALVGATVASAHAQEEGGAWESIGGPVGFVTHLAAAPDSPDFLFIFLAQGLYRNNDRTQTSQGYSRVSWAPYFSTDGGETWQAASNDLAHVQPTLLHITRGQGGDILWVGTAAQGLWRSDNGGRNWRPLLVRGLGDQRALALAEGSRGQLYLLTLENTRYPASYLFASSDGGLSWTQRLVQSYTGTPATQVSDLVADPFQAGRLYAVTHGGLLFSQDEGLTWRQAPVTLPDGAFPGGESVLAADPTQRGRLYLVNRSTNLDGSDQLALYRSLDSGETWERLPAQFALSAAPAPGNSPRPLRLRLDAVNRRQLFLATSQGLLLSTDAGLTWRSAGAALDGVTVADLFSHPRRRGRWIAVGAGGIWRTANAGSQWLALGAGLPPAANLHSLVALPAQPDILLALHGGPIPLENAVHPVWRSLDGGKSWLPAMQGLTGALVQQLYVHPPDPDAVYALAASGVARSSDRGRSWRYTPLPASPLHLAFGPRPGQVYAATLAGLWASEDGGAAWTRLDLGERPIPALAVDRRGYLLAVAAEAGGAQLWRSEDGGARWEMRAVLPAGEIAALHTHPVVNDFLILRLTWGGLHLSVDGGRTWVRSDAGILAGTRWRGAQPEEPPGPNLLALSIDPSDPAVWWASSEGGGVYRSANNGRAWVQAGADLGDNLIFAFAHSEGRLLAAAGSLGVVEQRRSVTGQAIPPAVDVRIEIVWPHAFAPVESARLANLGLRLYQSRTLEPPPCAWSPNIEVWMARDAEPLRRLDLATQRTAADHPFPFWELNDVDVSWANDPAHKLIFLARVAPGLAESFSSPWIHASDARTYLPQPPSPSGLSAAPPAAIDALIRVVWPHDGQGQYAAVEAADLVNISALLFARDTQITLAAEHLPERVWLVGALDTQVGRRLMAGTPQRVQGDGFVFTTYEFNNVDVRLARDPGHHWSFWLEVPEMDVTSNVWVHGSDARTKAPHVLEPISGCRP